MNRRVKTGKGWKAVSEQITRLRSDIPFNGLDSFVSFGLQFPVFLNVPYIDGNGTLLAKEKLQQ